MNGDHAIRGVVDQEEASVDHKRAAQVRNVCLNREIQQTVLQTTFTVNQHVLIANVEIERHLRTVSVPLDEIAAFELEAIGFVDVEGEGPALGLRWKLEA